MIYIFNRQKQLIHVSNDESTCMEAISDIIGVPLGTLSVSKEKIKRKAQISGWLLLGEHGNFQLSLYNIHKIGATKLMGEYI